MLRTDNASSRPARRRIRRTSESGFIQTLELLVLMAIFGTVFYFALELAYGWLIQQIDPLGGKQVTVYDQTGSFITRTNSFVGNEAPVRVFRTDTHEAAILGVRAETDGGFTTHQRLYYTGSYDCGQSLAPGAVAMLEWIIDPTTAAGARVQFVRWDDSYDFPSSYTAALPALEPLVGPAAALDLGYGHPISDFYSLQTIAFAMGPDAMLRRAHGTLSGTPVIAFDGSTYGWPTSEWDSTRYDTDRCRRIGDYTTVLASASEEQLALGEHLVQVDNWYQVTDANNIPYTPEFWVPAAYSTVDPTPVVGSNFLDVVSTTDESDVAGAGFNTFTDGDGLVHTLPETESDGPDLP